MVCRSVPSSEADGVNLLPDAVELPKSFAVVEKSYKPLGSV